MERIKNPLLEATEQSPLQFPSLQRPDREQSFIQDRLPSILAVLSGLAKGMSGSEGIRRRAMPESKALLGEITAGKRQAELDRQQQWYQDLMLEIQKVGFEAKEKQRQFENLATIAGQEFEKEKLEETKEYHKGTLEAQEKQIGIAEEELELRKQELEQKKVIDAAKAATGQEFNTIEEIISALLVQKTVRVLSPDEQKVFDEALGIYKEIKINAIEELIRTLNLGRGLTP